MNNKIKIIGFIALCSLACAITLNARRPRGHHRGHRGDGLGFVLPLFTTMAVAAAASDGHSEEQTTLRTNINVVIDSMNNQEKKMKNIAERIQSLHNRLTALETKLSQ